MKVAIVGSRGLTAELPFELIGNNYSQIISGGAEGIDRLAREYAIKHSIEILEILPQYDLYGKIAPLIRNNDIVRLADMVYIFWDGKSRGSQYVIKRSLETNTHMKIFREENGTYILANEIPYLPEFPDCDTKKYAPTIIYE